MSSIHVTAGSGNLYTVFVHLAVPGSNNAAGVPWATAVVNSGRNVTQMVTGAGAGQITSAEAAEIAAGTTIEGSFQWQDNPTWTNAQRQNDLDFRAGQMQAELQARFQNELRYFGFTR